MAKAKKIERNAANSSQKHADRSGVLVSFDCIRKTKFEDHFYPEKDS